MLAQMQQALSTGVFADERILFRTPTADYDALLHLKPACLANRPCAVDPVRSAIFGGESDAVAHP